MDGVGKARGEEERQEEDAGQQLGKQALELLYFPPLMTHVALVLFGGWIASRLELNLLFVFSLGFAYLCYIENRQRQKIETRIRNDERKSTDRKRLLSDAETARWLNNVVESVWPIFLEKFASEFLLRLAPWFLEKFKPWTAKNVVLQRLYLGKIPPVFTFFRAGRHPTDGDHVVLEMTVNFSAARDMHASMAVQMRKRVGLGIWASFQISNIQVEGKLKVGVRFVRGWPVIGRLRICFSEAPVIRMVAKPLFNYGVDVTDLPGIAAWLDKMIIDALEQCLVEPNLLVVDVDKLVSDVISVNAMTRTSKSTSPDCSAAGDWFSVGKSDPVATLLIEILEADQLKPSDPNGKADPYVKIVLGKTEFLTSIKRKTLEPSWHEQFRIPIANWAIPTLVLRVRDKDRFLDDEMGHKQIKIDDVKDGERHDMWLHLDGVKTGRLRVALTVEGTLPVDERGNNSFDSLQFEDARKEAGRSPISESAREANDVARSGSSGEAFGSDSDLTPLKDESQAVNVGVGQSGCIAIVNPGRHVVKEAYSTERQRQRKKPSKGSADGEKEPELSSSWQREELDCVELDLNAGGQPARKSRVGNTLGRNQIQDPRKDSLGTDESGDALHDATEVVVVGNNGSKVHTKLELDDDGVGDLAEHGSQDELPLVPPSGDFPGGNSDASERHFRHMLGRSSMKRMGKGVMKQAGKTAQHMFKKFQPGKSDPDSPQSLTADSQLNSPMSLTQEKIHNSNKTVLAEEQLQEERPSLQSEIGSLDQSLQKMADEGPMPGDTRREEIIPNNQETPPCKATQSLTDSGFTEEHSQMLKPDDMHTSDEVSLVEESHQREGGSPQAERGSLDHSGQDMANERDMPGQTHGDEIKSGNQETPPGVSTRLQPVPAESVDQEDPRLQDARSEDSLEPDAQLPQRLDVNVSEGDDADDGLPKSVDADHNITQSIEHNPPQVQSLQNLTEYQGERLPTPSTTSKPPTRDPPPLPTSPRPAEIARHGPTSPLPEK